MKIATEEVSQVELTQKSKKKTPKPKKPKEPRDIRYMFRKGLKSIDIDKLKKPWMAQKAFRLINTASDLRAWVDGVLADTSRHKEINGVLTPVIALDTEGTGLDTRILVDRVLKADGTWELTYEVHIELAGICLSSDGMDGIYIPVTHEKQDQDLQIKATNIDRAECAEILQYLFDRCHLVFYNAKYDREVLRLTMGINFRPYPHFEDVQVLAYINDPKADLGDKGAQYGGGSGLKALSKNVLGMEQIELDEIAVVKCDYCPVTGGPFCQCTAEERKAKKHTLKNHHAPFPWIPTDIALWYAAGDAICTWLLWEKMHKLAISRKLIHNIDHELVESITWIERQRWMVDTDRHRRTVKGHANKLASMRAELRQLALASGYEEVQQEDGTVLEDNQFNPNSTAQLQKLLFNIKRFDISKTTSSGNPSCDAEALADMHKEHPDDKFLEVLMNYRDYLALHPDNLRYDPRDHSARIYLKQNVVAGGRLAGAGGDFEKDGGFGLNPQGIKKIESHLMWKVKGNVLEPDEIPVNEIETYEESDLHPSCFKEIEKEIVVGYREDDGDVPPPIVITLSNAEREIANRLGAQRDEEAAAAGRNPDWKDSKGGSILENHQDGVAAEMCHIRMLGYSLDDYENENFRINTFKQADWGANSEVRSTKMSHYAGKVKDRDIDSRVVIFYRKVNDCKFTLLGWLTVAEAKAIGKREDPGGRGKPAYFVKDNQLKSIGTLPEDCGKPSIKLECSSTSVPVYEKRKVKKKAPGIINNHIGQYMGYAICLVPKCTSCAKKHGILIEDAKIDANEVINLRVLFQAPPGWTLFTVDYSNIEMRCAANVSGEPEFINEFLHGKGDFHSLTASKVFKEFTDPATSKADRKALRNLAKIINFALLYGGTEYTIFENMKKQKPDITWQEAKDMVARYWEGVPVFWEFCQNKQQVAKEQLLCKTATGRVISFKSAMEAQHIRVPVDEEMQNLWKYRDLNKKAEQCKKDNDMEKSAIYRAMADRLWKDPETGVRNAMDYNKFMGKIQRVSVNVPLQGLAGDFMRMALNRIRKWVESDPLVQQIFHLHGSIHDEVDFIVKNEYVPFILPRITRLMKLRKLHDKMGWQVPIESDAEYGQSWDVEHHVTGDDDHKPAAWTEIKGMDTYIPDGWDVDTLKNLIKAMASGEEVRVNKVTKFLEENLHPRAFEAAKYFFKAEDDRTRKKALIAALQLDEYWRVDNTPDDEDDKLEKLADFEARNELGVAYHDPLTPEFGYLGAIPLTANIIRPSVEILGEYVPTEDIEVMVSPDSIKVSIEEPLQASLSFEDGDCVCEDCTEPIVDDSLPEVEEAKVEINESPSASVEESVFAETPVIRKKVVEQVTASSIEIPKDGIPTYEIIDLDENLLVRFKAKLGSGGKSVRVLYRGKLVTFSKTNVTEIDKEFVKAVHNT